MGAASYAEEPARIHAVLARNPERAARIHAALARNPERVARICISLTRLNNTKLQFGEKRVTGGCAAVQFISPDRIVSKRKTLSKEGIIWSKQHVKEKTRKK